MVYACHQPERYSHAKRCVMSLRPASLPLIPDATAAAVRAAFPKGNLYVDLRTEFGTLSTDQLFADLYPPQGRPVEIAPWRLARVVVMQYMEGLTDRQAADAVRRCMDWKYALRLDWHDPGFDFTLLHDFRQRLLTHAAAQRLRDTFLSPCKARGWITARGTQRTDSTQVLAAIRNLHRLECVLEAMHDALNQLSDADPTWVQPHGLLEWYARYGLRSDQARLPKDASKREALACQIGVRLSPFGRGVGRRECAVPPRPPRRGRAPADMAATILPLYRPRARSAPVAHDGRTTACGGAHHLALRPGRPLLHETRHPWGGLQAPPHGDL